MPTREYIPIDDAKITTEKQVKPKPSTAELTTIERPGTTPISIETSIKKVRKRKSPSKRKPSEIRQPKKDSIIILTEKPQAAQKIANALSNFPEKHVENKASYFTLTYKNKKIIVASAVGHLFNLNYVSGQKGWPVFKLEWIPSHTQKKASFTKTYFNLLKKLSKRAEEIIIATDYDIEGEVIGWNILRFIFEKKTAKRMKFSTLTKQELLKSYDKPLPEPDWGHAYAGETRHILDWLYGINLSRALMSAIKTTGSFKLLSIGRVQGPALKIIVDREKEIASFTPQPYWQVLAKANNLDFKHPKDIFDEKQLSLFKDIKEANAETKKSEERLQPPAPFDLTTLQREAYRWHSTSPSQTLKIAQKLYLDGLISYPRTSSQKIPDSIEPKKIISQLKKHFPLLTAFATRKTPIEGKKSDPAHPSIYPTGEFKTLKDLEFKIYNLIVKRFLSAFSPDLKTANKRITLTTDKQDPNNPDKNITFKTSGLKILEKGWTQVYPIKLEEKNIPDINGFISIENLTFPEKETLPPKRFSPASLITLLEKKNLGTKATRSQIVETLFTRGYLDGKSIKATSLGIKLIETLEKNSPIIIDENLTRNIENEIEALQKNKASHLEREKEIISKAERIITDISKEFKSKEVQIGRELLEGLEVQREKENQSNILLTCPTCKKGELRALFSRKTKRSFVGCSAYPKCTQTYSLPPNFLIKKSNKTCTKWSSPRLLERNKARSPWEFCFNSKCETNIQRLEKWKAKQNLKS
jgi:DNA topoisomerase I